MTEYESLKNEWLQLEQNNPVPFFLTWHWVSCWMKTYQPEIIAVSAIRENEVVAIGLFTISVEIRNGIVRSRQLRLHQLGDITMDQICMEYNDFIANDLHKVKAINACLEVLQRSEFGWDEIILPMMPCSRAEDISSALNHARIGARDPCFAVDLSKIRNADREYVQYLTANSRYQIRHSVKLYEQKYGALNLYKAGDREEALAFFHEAGKYHMMRWPDSGYNNQHFVRFHENLIKDSFKDNSIDLLKLVAGDQTIAVMYYQLVDRKVFFYLHGLRYENDGKLKPGLVAHALATEYYIQQGMDAYDYMGGNSQYKIQLAERTEDLSTVVIQRPSLQFWFEKTARGIKNQFKSES